MKPKLEYASTGPYVSEAQGKLNLLMPEPPVLVVDGKYGTKTVQRVKKFQVSRGLIADGIVGAKTWAALDSSAPAVPGGSAGQKPSTPPPKITLGIRVHSGAMTFCSCGSAPGQLSVNEPGRSVVVVRDCVAYTNISPFGVCKSFGNPMVLSATNAALGVLTPMPCTPATVGLWSPPGTPIELAGNPPAPMVGMHSILVCRFGGEINIISPG